MHPSLEEALSYLTGLAPVGTPVAVPFAWARDDLRIECRKLWYSRLDALVGAGCVERISRGGGCTPGEVRVVRALEPGRGVNAKKPVAFAAPTGEKRQPSPVHTAGHAHIHEHARRLMLEIPPDTRGLTARLMGDPLPGRGALDRRMGGAGW